MALTRDELRAWAQYIRGDLINAADHDRCPHPIALEDLHEMLRHLGSMKISIRTLSYTRIHDALMEMLVMESQWPPGINLKVETILQWWEEQFGPLEDIKLNLWGRKGPMEGLVLGVRGMKPSWVVRTPLEISPYQEGHNGQEVGQWWIKAAAASRDGVIHDSWRKITANRSGAYAVLMTRNDEIEAVGGMIKYRAPERDPGCHWLMKNVLSQRRIRVLRNWRLESRLRPKVGLRYDGLYRVAGFGVKLIATSEQDEWQYTFQLKREPGQTSLERVLCHPNAEEMDDWNQYQSLKSTWKGVGDPGSEGSRDWKFLGESESELERVDSGYESRGQSEGDKSNETLRPLKKGKIEMMEKGASYFSARP